MYQTLTTNPHQRFSSTSSSSSDTSINKNYDKMKRTQSLEKNRMAAYRCRERKKHEQRQMVEQADFLSSRNESLQHIVDGLKNEVISLRELLMAHDTCNCEQIHSYIQRSSSRI